MTARSIGDLLSGTETKFRRTFQPVRRNSYHEGERERQVWRPIPGRWREVAARMKAAQFYDRVNKQPGQRNGPLGHVAIDVLRELYNIVDFKSGRCDPAIETICKAIRRSRAAVVAAMARLKEHGFLEWIRRTEPTDNEGFGPQVRQITNAYGFCLPQRAAAFVDKLLGRGSPAPADDVQRREDDKKSTDEMLTSIPAADLASMMVDDPELARQLAEIGRSLDASNASSPSGQNPD